MKPPAVSAADTTADDTMSSVVREEEEGEWGEEGKEREEEEEGSSSSALDSLSVRLSEHSGRGERDLRVVLLEYSSAEGGTTFRPREGFSAA